MPKEIKWPRGRVKCLGPRDQNVLRVARRITSEDEKPCFRINKNMAERRVISLIIVQIAYVLSNMREQEFNNIANNLGWNVEDGPQTDEVTTDFMISYFFNVDKKDVAQALNAFGRRGCGYDLRGLYSQYPSDGEEHSDNCPECGRLVRWIAPKKN